MKILHFSGGGDLWKYNDRSQLPPIGPATNFYDFPADDPEKAVRSLGGEERIFAEAELALIRCDFARARDLCEKLWRSERYSMAAIRIAVIAAIGLGDLPLLDGILARITKIRLSSSDELVKELVADVVEGWLSQWLWLSDGYPEWILRFDFRGIPESLRHPAAYLGVMARLNAGQFEAAYAAAALMMGFDKTVARHEGYLTAAKTYLRMARAISCRETGRMDEMHKWLEEVIRELAPHGILLPFLLFMSGSRKAPTEEILAEVAPNEVARYRKLRRSYFVNLIRARNHITGEKVSEALSIREFYLAMLLKRGLSYKELADRFDLSVGRIKNLLQELYQKLNIHSRAQIKTHVW